MSIIIRYFLLFITAVATILPIPAQLLLESPPSRLQVTPAPTYGAKESKKREFAFGGYWSAARQMPPLPFNPFPELPVYDVGSNTFVYDDRKVDYPALRAQWSAEQAEREEVEGAMGLRGPGGAGAAMLMSSYTGLWLELEVVDDYALLTLHNTEPGTNYQIFSSTNVAAPADQWTLEQTLVGVDGQDTTRTVFQRLGRTNLFFKAASTPGGDPALHLTQVRQPMLPEPFIQIRGYTEKALSLIHFKVESLTLGAAQNRGWVTKQYYDFKTYQLTTNWWQCFDVELFPGFNRVTISVVDREGNTNRTTLHYAVAFLPNRPPPQVLDVWPAPGARVPGSQVSLRGTLGNPTATVTASVTPGGNSGGATQTVNGVVDRDGTFRVDNVNLTQGDNGVSLVVTDAGGLSATNQWTITNLPELEFSANISMPGDYFLTINGQVPNAGYTVTINGTPAQVLSNAGFSETVPIPSANSGGPAVFHVVATGGGQTLERELIYEKPQRLFLFAYDREQITSEPWSECDTYFGGNVVESTSTTNVVQWEKYVGGLESTRTRSSTSCDVQNPPAHPFVYQHSEVRWNEIEQRIEQGGTNNSQVSYDREACSGTAQHDFFRYPPGDFLHLEHLRHAQSQLHLRSGGRSTAKRSKLLRFDGHGETFTPNTYAPNVDTNNLDLWFWWPLSTATTNYALAPMGLLGGTLPTNQPLFVSVPAGVDIDATPTIAGDVVKFNHLEAHDATPRLSSGLNTPVPEGVDPALVEERLKEQAPGASNPGRLIFVNNGDADHDGVPNFADGYGLHGASTPDSGGRFAPITLTLPSAIDPSVAKIRFSYQAADPGNVTATPAAGGTFTNYAPGGSGLRLWSKDGSASRLPDPVSGSVGDFIPSGQPIELAWLLPAPLPISGASLTIYAEAVNASGSAGDLVVTVSVDPDGDAGPAGFEGTDFVRFTALDVGLGEVSANGQIQEADPADSHPSPVISATASISNVRPNADGSQIIGDLSVAGTITAAVCDLTPGAAGTIPAVYLYVNNHESHLAALPTAISKSTNATALRAPYPFSGAFSAVFEGVTLDTGVNLIRLAAADDVLGITGYSELTCNITAQDLLGTPDEDMDYKHLRITVDVPGITALSQITATTPVLLSIINVNGAGNPGYAGALYRASSSPLVFTNPVAWVVVPNPSEFDSALNSGTQGQFDVIVSAPSVAPANVRARLTETGAATSRFEFDWISFGFALSGPLNPNAPDMIAAFAYRVGQAWITNTLTETGDNTLTFQDAGQNFIVQLGGAPTLDSNVVESASATVTSTALGFSNYSFATAETGTNSRVFVTNDELVFDEPAFGQNFGWAFSAGACSVSAASTGGELHIHVLSVQGPADVLALLAARPDSGIMAGPGGKFYLSGDPQKQRPGTFVMTPAGAAGDLTLEDVGGFVTGFARGFAKGGVSLVTDTVQVAAVLTKTAARIALAPLVCLFGDCFAQERQFLRQSLQVVGTLAGKVQEIAQGVDATVDAALSGDLAGAAEASEPMRVGMENAVEFLQEAWTEFANSSPGAKGEVFGRVTFEVVSFAVPISKPGQIIGKLEFVNRLRTSSALVAADSRLVAAAERAVEKLAATPGLCFAAGTPVHTRDGLKNIEAVQPGDWVWSRDPLTGEKALKPVLGTYVTHPDRLYHLVYQAREGGDEEHLATTGNHPFFVRNRGAFITADKLVAGDVFLLASGDEAELTRIETEDAPNRQPFTTYNLEVADYHTYFAGASGVWVHNLGERICSRFRSLYRKARQGGKNPWGAFEEAAPLNRTANGGDVGEVGQQCLNQIMGLNPQGQLHYPLNEFPSVKNINDVLRGRKGTEVRVNRRGKQYSGSRLEVHHIPPRHAIEDLKQTPGLLKPGVNPDDCPGIIFSHADHQGGVGIHSFLDAELAQLGKRPYRDFDAVRDALGRGYESAGRPDLKKLMEEWMNSVKGP